VILSNFGVPNLPLAATLSLVPVVIVTVYLLLARRPGAFRGLVWEAGAGAAVSSLCEGEPDGTRPLPDRRRGSPAVHVHPTGPGGDLRLQRERHVGLAAELALDEVGPAGDREQRPSRCLPDLDRHRPRGDPRGLGPRIPGGARDRASPVVRARG